MSVKPILFNTEMVRAILDGRKTQTRRLIKRKYGNTVLEMKTDKYGTRLIEIQKDEEGVTFGKHEDGSTWRKLRAYIEPQPAYKRGDILYVRETWNYGTVDSDCKECCPPEYWFVEEDYKKKDSHPRFIIDRFWYKADKEDEKDMENLHGWWRPSIHMPKEAARIWLRVTDVRLQQLQDISSEDIDAEGCKEYAYSAETGELLPSDPTWFRIIWDGTLSDKDKKEYGWMANPWVWAYHFERTEKP